MPLSREQSVNLRVGQTVMTKILKAPARISKITVVADGERVIQLLLTGEGPLSGITTWLGESQIESVVTP
ncbi:hypothetical protein ACRQ5Q_14895 [Bradyrhizobium sp. PMVTL-01]|uniref:hypothetical protein n=1 Tax=Bradyrhizobium sp. PMVTL-01 TaxID=3434999 RepID=UPI003F6FCD37